MKFLAFDVETTGLPAGKPQVYETHRWPFIVQFSWMVYDTSCNKLRKIEDHIIRLPEGLGICPESTAIHGITTEQMLSEGENINRILDMFMDDVQSCTILIAHNLKFDKSVVMVEQIRNNYTTLLSDLRKQEYCTMMKGRLAAGIRVYNRYFKRMEYKYPKLVELHSKLFNSKPNNLHNSLIDILVCFRCFGKLYWDVDMLTLNTKINALWLKFC